MHLVGDPLRNDDVYLGYSNYGAVMVYRALFNGRPAAIKVFNPYDDEEFVAKFRKEVKLMAMHGKEKGVVPVYAAGEIARGTNSNFLCYESFDSCQAMVMQLADCTLWHALNEPRSCPQEIVERLKTIPFKIRVLCAVASALDDCHHCPKEWRVAHRKVKSGNVLLTTGDDLSHPDQIPGVLLCDVGISRVDYINTGEPGGTSSAAYMAPEVIEEVAGSDLFAADVFSFGILM